MALPWLIGAAVVGAVSYAAKKMKEDEEEREWEERQERRREQEAEVRAEQARQAKALEERKQSKIREFATLGEEQASDFKQLLNGLVEVKYTQSPSFCASLLKNGHHITTPFIIDYELGFLDRESRENLTKFETLYQVQLHPGAIIYDARNQISDAQDILRKLQGVRQKLESKCNQIGKS